MLNRFFVRSLLVGWFAVVGILVVWSMAVDASLSTTLLLLALGVAPAIVSLLIESGAPPPTVAELLLYAVNTKDRR
jgi:hypothetical protein